MNFKKVLSLIIVAVFCITLFSGCGEENKNTPVTSTENSAPNPAKTIVLVGENEGDGFWQNVKKGGEYAAKKYGFTLKYTGTDEGTVNVVTSHITGIGKALNEGVSGVVVAPNGEGYSEIYGRLYDEKIPVVQIGNLTEDDFERLEGNRKNPIVSMIFTNNKQAGALCAERVFEKVKEDIKKSESIFVVGVIKREENASDEEKSNGFVEKFTELADADSQIKNKYKIETEAESDYRDSFVDLIREDAKAVFITDSTIADKISDIVSGDSEKYKEIVFCGFDSGAKQLKWLTMENGPQFIGGVARDSYNIGYNAVEQCIFSIQGKDIKEKIEIAGKWYDKENVDKMKQEKMVFEK